MMKLLFLLLLVSGSAISASAQSSQTSTGTLFNDFGFVYLNNWARYGPSYIAADDDVFAYSKKLSTGQGLLQMMVTGFQFSIPANATIDQIVVSVKRFKKGKGSVSDYFETLVRRSPTGSYASTGYGVRTADPNPYATTETLTQYAQAGSGNNGGINNEFYQWTPEMINDPKFGVRLDNYKPTGGSVEIYYDYVGITVYYTEAAAKPAPLATAVKPMALPVVYPNPFMSTASLQFTAAEGGTASVELYNMAGARVQVPYTGTVVQGQDLQVQVGEAKLPKGIYLYQVINGTQKQTGRMIKL
jgi:hypothetical protein